MSRPSTDEPVDNTPVLTPDNSRTPDVLRLTTNLIEVPFTVKDNKGRLVPGLTWRDVHVYENNVIMHPRIFTVDPYPLSVAVVIDNSLGTHEMATVSNALGALPGAFSPYDEVSVITYNNGPKVVTGFTGGQSARLTAAIELSKSTGREYGYYDTGGGLAHGIDINNGANDHENPLVSGGSGQSARHVADHAAQGIPRAQ